MPLLSPLQVLRMRDIHTLELPRELEAIPAASKVAISSLKPELDSIMAGYEQVKRLSSSSGDTSIGRSSPFASK